ncbi:hypothetical protein DPMN_082485 [Dreissena polymorpha]|uniref:Uncharacterized protein n=1 Tax=Dreissena polymorpha TaxID=45954 RepID=A0A9D3Y882_DREPO|nr:hypothetical protein DPMN_082485 [Dreissena polymorpha]
MHLISLSTLPINVFLDELEPQALPLNGCEVRQVTPNKGDNTSMSSLDSSSVSSSGSSYISSRSERDSPESTPEPPVTSPENSAEQMNRKKARINDTNEQIYTLLRPR